MSLSRQIWGAFGARILRPFGSRPWARLRAGHAGARGWFSPGRVPLTLVMHDPFVRTKPEGGYHEPHFKPPPDTGPPWAAAASGWPCRPLRKVKRSRFGMRCALPAIQTRSCFIQAREFQNRLVWTLKIKFFQAAQTNGRGDCPSGDVDYAVTAVFRAGLVRLRTRAAIKGFIGRVRGPRKRAIDGRSFLAPLTRLSGPV